ncbi:MAG: SIR2 family protein [Elusimicrobia bacterium]|nr:SIR2 family protein [Elusimicrobiota bacterium]
MLTHDPLRAALEIREQLASDKRKLAFFFGAGTSMAVGLPGIDVLTTKVPEHLQEPAKSQWEKVKKDLPEGANVEKVLDQIRACRELFGDSEDKEYGGLKGATAARNLDSAVCRAICEIVSGEPPKELKPHLIFAQWLRALHSTRDWPVEVFTTNYDLLLEEAMETSGVPFFDGFVGSVAPFFVPESVEAQTEKTDEAAYPPRSWTRLWKIHGSINWRIQKDTAGRRDRITRLSGSESQPGEELLVFPSREKYAQSRKLPFVAFQDRLRKLLSVGECLVVAVGYSFSDEHLNDVLFQGLRSNPRLAITALIHSELSHKLIQYGQDHRNLTLLGPDKACIGGIVASWGEPRKRKETEVWPFWDENSKHFTLGDFNSFTSFLEVVIGFRSPLSAAELDTSTSAGTKATPQDIS